MPFVERKDIGGFVWMPDPSKSPKRKPCEDCISCNQCGESRCRYCLNRTGQKTKKCHRSSAHGERHE